MNNEIKEIKLEKRKPTFDYILNDLAFDSLMFRVVNGIASSQDRFDFDYQVKLMQKEISHLRQNKARTLEYIKDRLEEGCLDKLNYYDLHKIENILQGEDKDE